MHLDSLQLNNFRSFDKSEIILQTDLTIFVGENNGGKSNAIDAVRLITSPLGGRRELYCEPTDVRFQSKRHDFEIEARFTGLSAAQQGRFISVITDATLKKAVVGLTYDTSNGSGARPTFWGGERRSTPETGCLDMVRHVYLPPLRDARRALASGNPTRVLALLNHFLEGSSSVEVAKQLARASGHAILEKVDDAVGTNLRALTTGAKLQTASLGFSTDETLTDIARDLRFKLAEHGVNPEDLQYSGHGYANLLYIAIIAVELERVKTADLTLFLVEEPEAHLHPQLQAAVLSFLQEQAEKSRRKEQPNYGPAGELQVIVATHSPNLSAWVANEKLVVFKTVAPPHSNPTATPVSSPHNSDELPLGDQSVEIAQSIATIDAASDLLESVNSPFVRRISHTIPLAKLPLDPVSRRKVDRYLDVTKSALLFGGRILLVEGISEALLIPAIAKRHVLHDREESYRIFRSAVFVPISGVDFEPYLSLLLTSHEGVRIADKVVVVTDGDHHGVDTNDKMDGDVRKDALDSLINRLGARDMCQVIVNGSSLEEELIVEGNEDLMKKTFLKLRPRSTSRWEEAMRLSGMEKSAAIQKIFQQLPKGDFAQQLASFIEDGASFRTPKYIHNAISNLVAK